MLTCNCFTFRAGQVCGGIKTVNGRIELGERKGGDFRCVELHRNKPPILTNGNEVFVAHLERLGGTNNYPVISKDLDLAGRAFVRLIDVRWNKVRDHESETVAYGWAHRGNAGVLNDALIYMPPNGIVTVECPEGKYVLFNRDTVHCLLLDKEVEALMTALSNPVHQSF